MKRQFVVLAIVVASLSMVQCGGPPPATEVPPPTAPAIEAPTATEVPPTETPVATEAPATKEAPPTPDGKTLLQERCTECHDLGRVERARKAEEEWKATVERMVGRGTQLSQAEQELVIQYLTETYPQ